MIRELTPQQHYALKDLGWYRSVSGLWWKPGTYQTQGDAGYTAEAAVREALRLIVVTRRALRGARP